MRTSGRTRTIAVISDTHGRHNELAIPPADVLVHAGDCTHFGKRADLDAFRRFLARLPHPRKIYIGGNHDHPLAALAAEGGHGVADRAVGIYLCDRSVTLDGITYYGSPWQSHYPKMAFYCPPSQIGEKWAAIPPGVDVLITHLPPAGIGDRIYDGRRVGSRQLTARVRALAPQAHLFGHVHENAGTVTHNGTQFCNAAVCDMDYRVVRGATVVRVETG